MSESTYKLHMLLNEAECFKDLTHVETMIVVQEVLSVVISDHLKYELRIERHGCEHFKADEYREGPCWECEREQNPDKYCAECGEPKESCVRE